MRALHSNQHFTAICRASSRFWFGRLPAIVLLISSLTVEMSTHSSMAQLEQPAESVSVLLCFEQGPPERSIPHNLLQLLAAQGVAVVEPTITQILPDVAPTVSVLTKDGELFLVADPPGGVAQVTVEAKDAQTGERVTVEINLHVLACPNLPAPPSGNDKPNLVAVVPAGALSLCVGEKRGVYFAVVTMAGGLTHVDPARITRVQVLAGNPASIDVEPSPISADQPAAFGWLHFTGLAEGNVTLEVTGQAQPVGLSPFTDEVTTTLDINIKACDPPDTLNNPCPAGTIRAGNFAPSAPFVAGVPLANIPAAADGPYVGMERFEVGVTPAALQPPQWDFPTEPGGVVKHLSLGERRTIEGMRTDFFIWGQPFLEPSPPDPARRLPAKWVAYRGYLNCQVPPVPVIVWKVPPIELPKPGVLLPVHIGLPSDIRTVIETLGVQPRELPESQRNESNKVFEFVRGEPPLASLGLNKWSGSLEGVLCYDDVHIVVRVCQATPPGTYQLVYDVLGRTTSTTTTRQVVAQLQVEVEIVPLELTGSTSSSQVNLKVTACVLAPSGPSAGSYVSVEPGVLITGNPAALSGRTPYQRSVTTGSTVTLTAPSTHVDKDFGNIKFDHWRDGEPPGGVPITSSHTVTLQLNSDKTVCAVYEK